jgi:hypothetical protein
MEEFRADILRRTLRDMKKELADNQGNIDQIVRKNIQVKAPISNAELVKRGLKREREDDHDARSDESDDPWGISTYEKDYPKFRFSCMARRALYDILLDQLEDGKIPTWPRKIVEQESGPVDQATGLRKVTLVEKIRVPSLSYFLRTLRDISNISFWKNPSFTKCDLCVRLRNMMRRKTIALSEKNAIRRARNQHFFYVMSEVQEVFAS